MRKTCNKLRVFAMAVIAPIVGWAYTEAETNHLVWAMLQRARMQSDNIVNSDAVLITPDFSIPDVFFAIRTEQPWTRVEKEAAFGAFVESMWTMDLGPNTNVGRIDVPNPISAVYQCVEMNYTNAIPAIRRLAFNPTLVGLHRRRIVDQCIALASVDDEMTCFIEVFLTNRVNYTWKDRRVAFAYADKVVAAIVSNCVPRAVCNRAARMFYRAWQDDDWELAPRFDQFMASLSSTYAVSSNRLAFIEHALSNTNISDNAEEQYVKTRFVSITNRLHSCEQPLPQWNLEEIGE